jgi:hypothetical protein
MPNEYDIITRYTSAGWIGILIIDGNEQYRTGGYKTGPVAALTAVQFWMQNNL